MTPDAFVDALGRHRCTAIIRARSEAVARAAMDAAVRAGVRIVEFTATTPGAFALVEAFANREVEPVDGLDRIVAGVGTVLEREDLRRAADCGAQFVVSPVLDEDIVAGAAALGLAALPGVHTPTEMWRAHRAGAPLVKLFPAPAGGPAWLRSVLAPLPMLRVVPTNGVELGNVGEWLAAGAFAVGLVGDLFRSHWLDPLDVTAIEAHARRLRAAIAATDPMAAKPRDRP